MRILEKTALDCVEANRQICFVPVGFGGVWLTDQQAQVRLKRLLASLHYSSWLPGVALTACYSCYERRLGWECTAIQQLQHILPKAGYKWLCVADYLRMRVPKSFGQLAACGRAHKSPGHM